MKKMSLRYYWMLFFVLSALTRNAVAQTVVVSANQTPATAPIARYTLLTCNAVAQTVAVIANQTPATAPIARYTLLLLPFFRVRPTTTKFTQHYLNKPALIQTPIGNRSNQ